MAGAAGKVNRQGFPARGADASRIRSFFKRQNNGNAKKSCENPVKAETASNPSRLAADFSQPSVSISFSIHTSDYRPRETAMNSVGRKRLFIQTSDFR
jgi:hypothetical protein